MTGRNKPLDRGGGFRNRNRIFFRFIDNYVGDFNVSAGQRCNRCQVWLMVPRYPPTTTIAGSPKTEIQSRTVVFLLIGTITPPTPSTNTRSCDCDICSWQNPSSLEREILPPSRLAAISGDNRALNRQGEIAAILARARC